MNLSRKTDTLGTWNSIRRTLFLCLVIATLAVVLPISANATPPRALNQKLAATPTFMAGVAVDAQGNAFSVSPVTNLVYVLPASTGQLFGQHVVRGRIAPVLAIMGLDLAASVTVDSHGDLFVSNAGYADSITVITRANRTIFGQRFVANRSATLSAAHGIISPMGLAFGSRGELYVVSNALSDVAVIPATTDTYLGQFSPANQTTFLPVTANLPDASSIAVDAAGNLFLGGSAGIAVIAPVTTNLFGQSITSGAQVTLTAAVFASGDSCFDLSVNANGDLFFTHSSVAEVSVIPGSTTTSVFGSSVTPGVESQVVVGQGPTQFLGLNLDAHGNVFVVSTNQLGVIPVASGNIDGSTVIMGQLFTFPKNTPLNFSNGTTGDNVAVDAKGNAFFNSPGTNQVLVLPKVTSTLFGQKVRAGVVSVVHAASGLVEPSSLAFDHKGNLYIGQEPVGAVRVLARSTQRIFGQTISANSLTSLNAITSFGAVDTMAFDASGNLVLGTQSIPGAFVVPAKSGTFFGQSVQANVETQINLLTSVPFNNESMKFDSRGNLFFLKSTDATNIVSVLAPKATRIFGQYVPGRTVTTLNVLSAFRTQTFEATSLSVDPRGDLFVAGTGIWQGGSAGLLFVVAAKTGSILGSHVIANRITSIRGGTQGSEYVASCWANGQLWAMNSGGLWAI